MAPRRTAWDRLREGSVPPDAPEPVPAPKTPPEPPAAPAPADLGKLYVVRLFDMFDSWIDITKPLPRAEAQAVWDRETKHGTEKTKFSDGDYYDIFQANTRMVVTPEFLGR